MSEDTYPGSRHPIPEDKPTPPEPTYEGPPWDVNPKVMVVKGEEIEFFTIGSLAKALNRQVVTIRKWEKLGYIPKARYRTAGKKQDRLYTRAQIEGMMRLAEDEGLMDPTAKVRIPNTTFPVRVKALFKALEGK